MCLQAAITEAGGSFSAELVSSISQSDAAPACSKKKFGHWCLDGKRISRGGIIAVIVVGSLLVVAALAAIPALALWRAKKARNYDQVRSMYARVGAAIVCLHASIGMSACHHAGL